MKQLTVPGWLERLWFQIQKPGHGSNLEKPWRTFGINEVLANHSATLKGKAGPGHLVWVGKLPTNSLDGWILLLLFLVISSLGRITQCKCNDSVNSSQLLGKRLNVMT